jgi:hypothetical protein
MEDGRQTYEYHKKFDDFMNIVFVFADLDISEKMAGYQPEWNCRTLKMNKQSSIHYLLS